MIYVMIKWMLGLFVLINIRIAVVKSRNITKDKGKELWPLEKVNITDPSKPPPKLLLGSIKVCLSRKNSKKMPVNSF